MTEISRFWDGTVLGDAIQVTQTEFCEQYWRAILNGSGNRGPLENWLNEMEVTGTTSPVSVNTGSAIVYGHPYVSDTPVSVSIPTPAAGLERYDRVVLRCDWPAQEVRIARVAGVAAAAPAVPSLTQSAGAVWEVPLATVLVDDAGVVTVTDAREFCTFSCQFHGTVVDTENYAEGAVGPAAVPNRTRYEVKGAGRIEPDSGTGATWTAGTPDYWSFADAATNIVWAYFMGPVGLVGASVDIYLHTTPHVNGAGAGVENAQWDYDVYYGAEGGTLSTANGTVNVDQQARVNTTAYRDQLIAGQALDANAILIVKLSRDGATDSYNNAMRLHAIEMSWTADC